MSTAPALEDLAGAVVGFGDASGHDALMELVKSGAIEPAEALDRAVDKTGIKRELAAARFPVTQTDPGIG